LSAPKTRGPIPGYTFVLLDHVDEDGQPRTSEVAKSWIRADAAKRWRAQQAENQVSNIRYPTYAMNRETDKV
jgi:hypothetical protein